MARADPARAGLTVRCAIYTRKSSDEGLGQEFNSLDAQREACEAYIVSQRHAGWVALADMYDDGGLSGGTMERPALKRLLEDIKASKVQTVVVERPTPCRRWPSNTPIMLPGSGAGSPRMFCKRRATFGSAFWRARRPY